MPSDTQSVLVTGARGYLGQHIVTACRDAGHPVIQTGRKGGDDVVSVDLLDQHATASLIAETNPNVVIHAAAQVPSTAAGYQDADAAADNLRMVESLVAAKPRRIVFISSMTVYGPQDGRPVPETAPLAPESLYGESKCDAEIILARHGANGLSVRLPGLYGAPRSGGLVYNTIMAAVEGRPPRLPDAPLVWSAMHVRDAAAAICALISVDESGFAPVNVGYSGPVSVNVLTEVLADRYNRVSETPVAHPVFTFDLRRYQALTGRQPAAFNDAILAYASTLEEERP